MDLARAYLPLSEIEPVPVKPQSPESVKPLSERASKKIAKARDLADEQRYTEAAVELERSLRYDPNHPRILRALAMLHWQAGNLERARVQVARAMEGNPDDALLHYLSGRCHDAAGDLAAAIKAYRTVLVCGNLDGNPEIAAMSHYQLAQALATEGYLEAAVAQYSAFEGLAATIGATASQPEFVALLHSSGGSAGKEKSIILERLGRYAQAAKVLAPLVNASENAALGTRYASLWMRAGRLKKALAAARAIQSNSEQVIDLLFEIHRQSGHPERIVEDLRSRIAARPDDPHVLLSLADMLTRLDRHDEARHELQEYLGDHPDTEEVRARLADLLIAQSAWDDMLQVCAEAIERDPDRVSRFETRITALASNGEAVRHLLAAQTHGESAVAAYLRGRLAMETRRWELAENFLRDAVSAGPEPTPARAALATVYLRTFRYDKAIEIAGRVEHDTPEDSRLELILGQVHERLDDTEQAELHFKAAIQLDRTATRAMLELAKLLNRSGRRLQAQRQLKVLLEKDPGHEAARELLATTYFEERKLDVAIEQFEELARRAKTPATRARCKALLDQRHERDADVYRRTLIEIIDQHGSDAATWIAIAESYNIDTDPEKSHDAFQHALDTDPDSERATLGLIETSRRLLTFEEAIRWLETLLPRRPNRHMWRIGLIELYWIVQDHDTALSLARQAESREDLDDTRRTLYRLAIVDTLRLKGGNDEALSLLKTWADTEPQPAEWSARLGEAYLLEDQAPNAVPLFEAVYRSDPSDRDAMRLLVRALMAAGRHDRAAQYLLDRIDEDPENDNAIWALAVVLRAAEQVQAALDLIRSQLLHTFVRQEFQDLMLDLLTQAGRYDECLDLIETLIDEALARMPRPREPRGDRQSEPVPRDAVTRFPDEPFTPENLHRRIVDLRLRSAAVMILAKDYMAAQRQLVSWLDASRNPAERFEILRRLALCHQARGDDSGANESQARALLLRPDNVSLNNDVAYWWIDKGVRLDEAEHMIRFALSRAPRQGAYLDTYGWLLYKKGRFAEAKKWLLRAVGLRADEDAVILDHLGDVCWRLGESNEAIERWTVAVEAAGNQTDEGFISADERRVRDTTQSKIDDARAGRTPAISPLAAPASDNDGETGTPEPGG